MQHQLISRRFIPDPGPTFGWGTHPGSAYIGHFIDGVDPNPPTLLSGLDVIHYYQIVFPDGEVATRFDYVDYEPVE